MKIEIKSQTEEATQVILQLLLPWKVTLTSSDKADIAITYEAKPPEEMKAIVIPSESHYFTRWLKDRGLTVTEEIGRKTLVSATPQTPLTIVSQTQYYYNGIVEPISAISQPPQGKLNSDILLLTLDVVKEYAKIINETLNPKMSIQYRLLTRFPIPYTIAPKRLKNFLMERKNLKTSLDLTDKLPLDALRYILTRALEGIINRRLERKTWAGKKFLCILTHDIDTREGLRRADKLKKIEDEYDVPSAWYVPSKRYKLDIEVIKDLANHGEIGAHDTKHDGKLDCIPKQKIVGRLREAKQTLEKIAGQPVKGFRSPLLQYSTKILQALKEAGYTYDTSIPTWEPKHPYTMRPHGIGTVYPLVLNGIIEIPVTLPQDHQMLYVLGMTPKQTVETWIKLMKIVKEIEGICTFLVHPDYELVNSDNLGAYEDLLNTLTSDSQACIITPAEAALRFKTAM